MSYVAIGVAALVALLLLQKSNDQPVDMTADDDEANEDQKTRNAVRVTAGQFMAPYDHVEIPNYANPVPQQTPGTFINTNLSAEGDLFDPYSQWTPAAFAGQRQSIKYINAILPQPMYGSMGRAQALTAETPTSSNEDMPISIAIISDDKMPYPQYLLNQQERIRGNVSAFYQGGQTLGNTSFQY